MSRRLIWLAALAGGLAAAALMVTRSGRMGAGSSDSSPGPDDAHDDPVTEASEESFPASDPPSYTPTTGSST